MTFVGKILVIVIMVFALFFLAVSTVVFTTSVNWREEVKKQKDLVSKAQSELRTAQDEAKNQVQALELAKQEQKKQEQILTARISQLEDEAKRASTQLAEQTKSVEEAQAATLAAQEEAKHRRDETEKLREMLSEVQKQANEFKLRQTELNDEIRSLTREVQVAQNNNRDLRGRNSALTTQLREAGITPNYNNTGSGTVPAQDVEGVVQRYDERSKRVELSIGKDDGLAVGNELDVFRLNPPEYIGRVRIEIVEPDQSIGRVIGNTNQGRKIKEGDIVATKIRTRG